MPELNQEASDALRKLDERHTTLQTQLAERDTELKQRTLQWEGVKDMLGTANAEIERLKLTHSAMEAVYKDSIHAHEKREAAYQAFVEAFDNFNLGPYITISNRTVVEARERLREVIDG